MHESNRRDGQNGRKRLLNTKLNARILVTLTVALAVVLAGCTSLGGLGGSDGEAGVAEAETPGGGGDGAGGGAGGADGAGNADSADGADSGDGADANAGGGSNELAKTDIQPRAEGWFNASKNGYVFEVHETGNGSGTATFEPPADSSELGGHTVTYDGDAQFKQAYTAMENEHQEPILYPLTLVDNLFSVANEDLAVGYENSTADGSLTTKITGVESYGGVKCYATEVSIDGERRLETCVVPYDEEVVVIYDIPPYMALYDEETGELALEIKLTEIREE